MTMHEGTRTLKARFRALKKRQGKGSPSMKEFARGLTGDAAAMADGWFARKAAPPRPKSVVRKPKVMKGPPAPKASKAPKAEKKR